MQTPLLIKWKGKIKPGSVNTSLVQNIDFAPTMLEMAGVSVPEWMQGLSLKSLITGKQKVPMAIGMPRNELYYRYYEYPVDHSVLPHLGIREKQFKLIYFYTVNEWEFYNLQADPQEQHNLVSLQKYQPEINRMKKRLLEVKKEYKDAEPAGEMK
jgi:arylsulfatase A-like enzyme